MDIHRKYQEWRERYLLYRESPVRLCAWWAFFQLPTEFLDALSCFGLYMSAPRMGTDPVLTAIALKRCIEVDWEKTAAKDGFVRYYFANEEAPRL